MRIGFGYDAHPLVTGKPLVIGGVTIPADKGAAGHSDADVLTHAIMDALLGAAALRDIGYHFPADDRWFENISSMHLLDDVMELIRSSGYEPANIDATVCLQRPKIAEYIPAMQRSLARVMGIDEDQVGVKATTTEHMGFVGRGEGIAAYAVALLFKPSP